MPINPYELAKAFKLKLNQIKSEAELLAFTNEYIEHVTKQALEETPSKNFWQEIIDGTKEHNAKKTSSATAELAREEKWINNFFVAVIEKFEEIEKKSRSLPSNADTENNSSILKFALFAENHSLIALSYILEREDAFTLTLMADNQSQDWFMEKNLLLLWKCSPYKVIDIIENYIGDSVYDDEGEHEYIESICNALKNNDEDDAQAKELKQAIIEYDDQALIQSLINLSIHWTKPTTAKLVFKFVANIAENYSEKISLLRYILKKKNFLDKNIIRTYINIQEIIEDEDNKIDKDAMSSEYLLWYGAKENLLTNLGKDYYADKEITNQIIEYVEKLQSKYKATTKHRIFPCNESAGAGPNPAVALGGPEQKKQKI